MLITPTQRGLELETDALVNGIPLPKLSALVLGSGTVDNTTTPENFVVQYRSEIVAQERLSPSVIKLFGNVPPENELLITEVGLELEDGTLYAYSPYQMDRGGFFKGAGFAFSFFVLHSREQQPEFTFSYSPLDIGAIADQIAYEANNNIDLNIQTYLESLLRTTSGLSSDVSKLITEINSIKSKLSNRG